MWRGANLRVVIARNYGRDSLYIYIVFVYITYATTTQNNKRAETGEAVAAAASASFPIKCVRARSYSSGYRLVNRASAKHAITSQSCLYY